MSEWNIQYLANKVKESLKIVREHLQNAGLLGTLDGNTMDRATESIQPPELEMVALNEGHWPTCCSIM